MDNKYKSILRIAFEMATGEGMMTRGYTFDQMVENWREFIYSHDFAKAFWGEEPMSIGDYEGVTYQNGGGSFKEIFKPAWQYHLQQMVLEENPIEYLKEYL